MEPLKISVDLFTCISVFRTYTQCLHNFMKLPAVGPRWPDLNSLGLRLRLRLRLRIHVIAPRFYFETCSVNIPFIYLQLREQCT